MKVRMQQWGLVPNSGNVLDVAQTLAPKFAVDIHQRAPSAAESSVPGGANLAGGYSIPDGTWTSSTATVVVNVTGSYTKEFRDQVASVEDQLVNFLPAWVLSQCVDNSGSGFQLDVSELDIVGFAE